MCVWSISEKTEESIKALQDEFNRVFADKSAKDEAIVHEIDNLKAKTNHEALKLALEETKSLI